MKLTVKLITTVTYEVDAAAFAADPHNVTYREAMSMCQREKTHSEADPASLLALPGAQIRAEVDVAEWNPDRPFDPARWEPYLAMGLVWLYTEQPAAARVDHFGEGITIPGMNRRLQFIPRGGAPGSIGPVVSLSAKESGLVRDGRWTRVVQDGETAALIAAIEQAGHEVDHHWGGDGLEFVSVQLVKPVPLSLTAAVRRDHRDGGSYRTAVRPEWPIAEEVAHGR